MLRFRKLFQPTEGLVRQCNCGRSITVSVQGGRETIIHELPWCRFFEGFIRELQANDPSTRLHQAAMIVETRETIVFADGDAAADVSEPVPPSRGDC